MGDGKQTIMIISGGVDPASNNYSQYLQTRRVADHFKKSSDLDVFFGSGITPESPKGTSPDVLKIIEDSYSFIRGEIEGNRPATIENIVAHFRNVLGKKDWFPSDRLLLFVTDHGNPKGWDPSSVSIDDDKKITSNFEDNCISLWAPQNLLYPEAGCFAATQLKKEMRDNVPRDIPVNYIMTQCYSGAFHLLGYYKDENGFPHKDGNICGFTASTKDETAAGCSPFTSEDIYDGYERRIVEAITGTSVMTGESISKPISELSIAHDRAMLADNTKDIPLRTSEAYVLDYLSAMPKEQRGSFESQLDAIWGDTISGRRIKADLRSPLNSDRERRQQLIHDLKKQFIKWHPMYSDAEQAGIKKISRMRRAVKDSIAALESHADDISKKISKLKEPLWADFVQHLKQTNDKADLEWIEFSLMSDYLSRSAYIIRLQREDPSLGKLGRFLNFEGTLTDRIVDWAMTRKDKYKTRDIENLVRLSYERNVTNNEVRTLESIEGQLRRIESQMTVFAMIEWLHMTNRKDALEDIGAFITCESEARIKQPAPAIP